MSKYIQIKDGEPVAYELPSIGTLPDGRKVSGFDKLDSDTLKTVGWLPFEDAGPPEHDSTTKGVDRTLNISKDKVIVVYTILICLNLSSLLSLRQLPKNKLMFLLIFLCQKV